jgi:hypothetical protein
MNKGYNFIFITEESIREFLIHYGKGPQSKDYELVTAILLKRFCDRQWNSDCWIGFELQDRHLNDIPQRGMASVEEIAEIIRKKVREDTPVDVAITKGTFDGPAKQGPVFQLKRWREDTDKLISYLNDMYKKYSPILGTLVIIFETNDEINFQKIQSEFDASRFPFAHLMFVSLADGKIHIGEIWPNAGMESYDPKDLIG